MRAEQKRAAKVSAKGAKRGGRPPKGSKSGERKRSPIDDLEAGKLEIEALGLEDSCSVM